MEKTVWVCTGGCGAKTSQEQYEAGEKTCGSPACANYGKPFEKRSECQACTALMREDEEHTCDAC